MKLLAHKIGDIVYYCNAEQIKEAGGLEEAAMKLHEKKHPPKKMKPKPVKAEVRNNEVEQVGEKPND